MSPFKKINPNVSTVFYYNSVLNWEMYAIAAAFDFSCSTVARSVLRSLRCSSHLLAPKKTAVFTADAHAALSSCRTPGALSAVSLCRR